MIFYIDDLKIEINSIYPLDYLYSVKGDVKKKIRIDIKRRDYLPPVSGKKIGETNRGEYYCNGDKLFWTYFDEFLFEVEKNKKRSKFYLRVDRGEYHFRTFILPYILNQVLALFNKFIIHSSCIYNAGFIQPALICFVGRPGAGKSTLAEELQTIGWLKFADDKIVLSNNNKVLSIFENNKTNKLELNKFKNFIIFPQKGKKERITEITKSEAAEKLGLSCLFPNYISVMKQGFESINRIIEQASVFKLEFIDKKIFNVGKILKLVTR
ncbi:MAG: hypothetical protein AB1765_09605 [Candidatus Hydrogenedentota bacterium]